MQQARIKMLIDLMGASDLTELTFSENGCTVQLFRTSLGAPAITSAMREIESAAAPGVGESVEAPSPVQMTDGTAGPVRAFNVAVLAPMFGIVHLTPAPHQPPFVDLDSTVVEGQTVAIIEAMKMFHQVTASRDGKISAIHVSPGDEVQAGQALFDLQ